MKTLSEYEVVYNKKIGMGYILPPDINMIEHLQEIPVKIGLRTIQPNTQTTLYGYFNIKPALYLGMKDNEMIFYLGSDENLFAKNHYYLALVKLTENRISSMFSHSGGRDFNLKNNTWK